jgi:glutathione-regulated potassium-efflux system protein KefB
VEPFRGILLGLFFLAVGMSLDVRIVAENWVIIALSVVSYMLVKAVAIYVIARLLRSPHAEALQRSVFMSQGGEFAFVLYTTAAAAGIIDAPTNAILTATVVISMVLTPFGIAGLRFVTPKSTPSMDGVDTASNLRGRVLIIGFGRFGQIASQPLLAMHHSVSIIDNDTDMIRAASRVGFKVYYGDGTRLDILHAAGADNAEIILICVNDKASATRIAKLLRDEFPLAKVMARAFDRGHAIELVKAGVDFQQRELFESALVFGGKAVTLLGASQEEADEVVIGVRERDNQRFELQMVGGAQMAGRHLLLSNAVDQARESGVAVPPEGAGEALEESRAPASPLL